ncbi:MAG: SbcC/MukB-like Walker B domain-containing protein [Pseudomonadales bacterium]
MNPLLEEVLSEEVKMADLMPLTYALTQLDVYNWGPFNRRHSAIINPQGTAIIGPTGSGKTTLVDAFMTLICAQPKYNLASTGGHESDRDLVSYVRGVVGAGNDSGSNAHIIRPGKTVTALVADFDNGKKLVRIAALFWLDGSSSAMSDLKRIWIFSTGVEYDIEDWLELQQSGGTRALKQLGRDVAGLQVFDSKKPYLAQLRRFFEVSENAFTLLNRAAGLKQINSIDILFRELVLDDHSAFLRAAEVAAEFDDLAGIHSELEIARQQQQSLQPIADQYEIHQTFSEQRLRLKALQSIQSIWYAKHGYALWKQQQQTLAENLQSSERHCIELAEQIGGVEARVNDLRDIFMDLGGASIESLDQQIKHQCQIVARSESNAEDYHLITTALQLDTELSRTALINNQNQAQALAEHHQTQLNTRQDEVYQKGAISLNCQEDVNKLTLEIGQIAKSRSNIPGVFLAFQTELSAAMGVELDQIPFAAELLEVKTESSRWRGAIERAIGAHRLRLMVPAGLMTQALAWVNNRNNRLHVRLLEVKEHSAHANFFEDGFTRKLNFKKHPYREALKHLLAGIDRRCVDSVEALQHTAHGMTEQGLMSGKTGYFDKQDQRELDQDWMTGFDNRDRLSNLKGQLNRAEAALAGVEKEATLAKQACAQLERGIKLLQQLEKQTFSEIDVAGANAELEILQQRLQAASDPDSDTGQAKQLWQSAKKQLEALRQRDRQLRDEKAVLAQNVEDARKTRDLAFERMGDGLTDEQQTLGDSHFKVPLLASITDQEQIAANALQQQVDRAIERINACEVKLAKLMTNAKKIDSGALAETGTDLEHVQDYLDQLRVLTEEALPEKLQRFLAYLNQSSDQGVTQLLMNIENEVEKIRQRIDDLNATMQRVDYQPGRYLRLIPKLVVHERLATLQRAQRHLRFAATKDDDGESHYSALQTVVDVLRDASERKKTQGAQALLDPRYRLQFSVSVIDRSTGDVIETRTSSQGGSGGEKEIIASYILTASLSYALCPDGSSLPLFGTIILDEAFSKSSQAVAGRIISALREFGLHPLFVTPNKEIKLLRTHTRSAVLIHNKNMRATMTCLSWEALEKAADQKRNEYDETAVRVG